MLSPCKDCPRRHLACHNVDTCPEWREYVNYKNAVREKRREDSMHGTDWERHLKRKGYKTPAK